MKVRVITKEGNSDSNSKNNYNLVDSLECFQF